MMNQVVLVGRLAGDINYKEYNDKKKAIITLAVPRPFKNAEGVYETDFIKCELFGVVASNTKEFVQKGDMIGIRGRLETRTIKNRTIINVIADKVSFLSQAKKDDEDND